MLFSGAEAPAETAAQKPNRTGDAVRVVDWQIRFHLARYLLVPTLGSVRFKGSL